MILIGQYDIDIEVHALVTLFERTTRISKNIRAEVMKLFGERCFETVIYKNTAINEATGTGKSVLSHNTHCIGSMNFKMLAEEVEECFKARKK